MSQLKTFFRRTTLFLTFLTFNVLEWPANQPIFMFADLYRFVTSVGVCDMQLYNSYFPSVCEWVSLWVSEWVCEFVTQKCPIQKCFFYKNIIRNDKLRKLTFEDFFDFFLLFFSSFSDGPQRTFFYLIKYYEALYLRKYFDSLP